MVELESHCWVAAGTYFSSFKVNRAGIVMETKRRPTTQHLSRSQNPRAAVQLMRTRQPHSFEPQDRRRSSRLPKGSHGCAQTCKENSTGRTAGSSVREDPAMFWSKYLDTGRRDLHRLVELG